MAPKIQHKRSSKPSSPPSAGVLAAGEIAINTNADSSNIHFEDAGGDVRSVGADPKTAGAYVRRIEADGDVGVWELNNASVDVGPNPPADPEEGNLWYDEGCEQLMIFDGSNWIETSMTMPTGGETAGGCRERAFYENDVEINEDYELRAGKNALSAGPVTIADGADITIPDGATWSVVGGTDSQSFDPAGFWKRGGTKIEPLNTGDDISTIGVISGGSAVFAGKAVSASTQSYDQGTTLATKDYVDANSGGGGGGGGGDFYAGAAAWGVVQGNSGDLSAGLNCTSKKNSTGNYTVTFTNPMPSDVYSVTTGNMQANSIVEIVSQDANGFNYLRKEPSSGTLTDLKTSFAVHATNALPPRGGTGADAWCQVNSSAGLEAGFNIQPPTKFGTGEYSIEFITPMPTADYAVALSGVGTTLAKVTVKRTTGFNVTTYSDVAGTKFDAAFDAVVHATNAQLPDTVTQEQLDAVLDNWKREGTTLKPVNAGDGIEVNGLGKFANPTDQSQAATFHAGNAQGQRVGLSLLGYPIQTGDLLKSTAFQVINAAGTATTSISPSYYEFSNAANQGYLGLENTQVVIGTEMGYTPKYYMFTNAGTFIASGTSYPSDRALKTGIQTVGNSFAVDVVKQLNPTTYQLKADSEGKTKYGFIAQEVEELIPQLVDEVTTPDGVTSKTLDYVSLIPVLTSSLQSALTRIEELEAKVQQLEGGSY